MAVGVGLSVTAEAATGSRERRAERPRRPPVVEGAAVEPVTATEAAPTTEVTGGAVAPPWRRILTPKSGGGLAVYPAPGAARPSQVLPPVNELGSPLVLLAVDEEMGWYLTLLPTRPNSSAAWVRAHDVTATPPVTRVELSRADHVLRVVRISDGNVLLESPVGFGKPSSPTPPGEYFVRDHFPTGSWSHPYGPFAFGLSGHSEVHEQFGTGDGRLAIHGTNQPRTIGIDASNGCPHVPNDVVLDMVPHLPLGTPVVIT